jgi:hypothetical protein
MLTNPEANAAAAVPDNSAKMQAILAATDSQAQDYFGHIIDQTGQPVVGAGVTGNLSSIQGSDVGEKERVLRTCGSALHRVIGA